MCCNSWRFFGVFSALKKVSDQRLVGNKGCFWWNLRLMTFASSFILAHNIDTARAWVSWSKEGTTGSLMIWTINFCANITKRQEQRDLQWLPQHSLYYIFNQLWLRLHFVKDSNKERIKFHLPRLPLRPLKLGGKLTLFNMAYWYALISHGGGAFLAPP